MGALDDITKKATDFLTSDKGQEALKSQKAEDISDRLLESAAGAANRVTGGSQAGRIDEARDAADRRIGTDDPA
ncbi:MAG: antitoxin [Burkholderiaceae bacterium]|nr:antitoxin [Microbacteriaceae bacterium]